MSDIMLYKFNESSMHAMFTHSVWVKNRVVHYVGSVIVVSVTRWQVVTTLTSSH